MPFYSTHVWKTELENTGKVVIKTDMSYRSYWALLLGLFIVGVVLSVGYIWRDYNGLDVIIVFAFLTVVILSVLYVSVFRYRDKGLIVDHDSLTLPDGFRLEWSEVQQVTKVSIGINSAAGFGIEVNARAWDRFVSQQSAVGRLNSHLNNSFQQRQTIYLSAIFGHNPSQLATWLNGFTMTARYNMEKEEF